MEEHGVTRNKMMFIQSTRPAAAALGLQGRPDAESFN